MTNKKIETLEETLGEPLAESSAEPLAEPSVEPLAEPSAEPKPDNNKKKGILIAIMSGAAAAILFVTTFFVAHFSKKNNDTKGENNLPTITTTAFDLNDIGSELEIPSTTTQKFGAVVSGTVKLEEIVEQDGKLYANKEEASEAKKPTTTSINLKNDTLKTSVVKGNGTTTVKVYDKTTGYEIKDETGKTVATGNLNNSEIPDGFEENKELGGIYEKEDNSELYTKCDADYYGYNEKGEYVVIYSKGEIIAKETLERAKKYLSTSKVPTTTVKNNSTTVTTTTTTTTTKSTTTTTKPSTTTTTANNTTTTQAITLAEGVVNPDGTYTVKGVTYADKATFQEIALSDLESIDIYMDENGVLHIKTEEHEKQLVK